MNTTIGCSIPGASQPIQLDENNNFIDPVTGELMHQLTVEEMPRHTLAQNYTPPDAVRPTTHWISDSGVCFCGANPYCADSTDGDDGCCYWQQKEPATQSPADTEGIE